MALKIGALAARTGASPPTIRYYEAIGLLPGPDRHANGQRSYGEDDVRRLTFIRRCRDFGFPIEQVRGLVALMQDRERSCLEASELVHEHLAAVRAKLAELRALEQSLAGFIESRESACAGGPAADCAILEDLANPAAYRASRHNRASA
jgi:DNA-binding transcriptional MerR regulator